MRRATSGLLKGRLLATSALVATALLVSPVARAGGPSGGSVAVGSATISTPNANKTVVDQSSNKALINWNSFSIPNGSSVVFNQPTANSLTVNRVTGPSASFIDGQMLANGNIWLLNSNGVMFGHGAQVNVGGLLATTSDITDDDFRKGRYRFTKPSANADAAVVNQGTITAAKGGSVVLSATQVSNEGVIRADLGSVVLGGARTFTVDLDGDNLIRYQVGKPVAQAPKDANGAAAPALVSNSGTISANGGSVLVTARAARNIENNVINNTGVVEANSVSARNGEIVFDAGPDGTVNAGGSISASGRGQGETGGSVSLTGGTVNVTDGATIDASGDHGGGTVQIGGGLHGQGSIANAQTTNVGKASISADAITQGDGGKISLWSDGETTFSGNASAKGGAEGGNGGIVETSGEKLHVGSDAKVDTSAAQGNTGTWLLDPTDIDIVSGGADGIGGSNIDPSTITSALASTNVSLQATNDITVDNNLTYSSANSLSLLAGHDIAFNASIQNSGNGAVVLSAHSIARSGNVSITAKSADITLTGDGSDGASIGTSANPLQLSVQSVALHTAGANAYIASLASTIALGASDLGTGDLTINPSGSVTQTGAIHLDALNITTLPGSVTLTNTGNTFNSISLGLTGGSASIYDASALTVTSALIGGDLTLSSGGAITQTGVIHTSGLVVSSTGGSINLSNTGNTFALATITTSGAYDASLYDASAMTVISANVGGKLTLSGASTVRQTGAIHAAALSASSTGGAITLTHASNTFGDVTLSTTGSLNASVYDSANMNIAGATVGGDLTLSGGGAITQSGALHANALSITTTNGAVTLSNAANTFNTVTVTTAGTDDATLADASALSVTSATVGGDLTLSGGNNIAQSGAIQASTLSASTTGGSIVLTDTGNSFATAALAATGDATIYQAAALVIASADVDGTLTLTSGSTIGQTGAIQAGTLDATTTNGAITLSNASNTIGTANLSTSGTDDATLYSASSLTIASAAIGGDLTLSGASIGQSGAIHTHDLNVSASGGAIALTNSGNTFNTLTVTTSGSGNASLYDALALSVTSANVGGALSLTSAGAITQVGAILAASLNATTTSGAITLTNAGNNFGAASLTTSGADNATLYDAASLTITGATVGGNLALTGGGAIGQSGAIHAHALSVTASSGAVTLANAGNTFDTLVLVASADASVHDASALSVTSANVGGDLTLSGGAAITQTGAIDADALIASTTGGAITLVNSGNTFDAANVATSGAYDATLYDASNLVMAGANVGGTLTLSGGGSIGQSGAIVAHALDVTTTNGAIALGNTGNAFATAALSTSGTDDATLYDASALTITSANIGGDFSLSGGASIGQSGAIHSATLNVSSSSGPISLTNTGNNFGPVYVATGGANDAALYNAPDLTLTGADVGGTLTLSSGGSILQTGAIHAGALNAATTNGDIVLSNTGNAFATATLSTSGTDDATLYDASNLIVSSANIGGTLNLSGAGTIGQSGAILAAALNVATTGGAITLTNTGNNFATASLATGGTDDASLYDASDLTVTSANVGGTLNLSGGGAVSQSGAIHSNGLNVTATGAITLANTGNTFATASLSTPGGATLYDASNLTITGATVGGTLALSGGGSIGQSGAIHADALSVTTTNGAIVLTNAGNAFNTATLATSGADDASLYDSLSLTIAGANVGGDLSLSGAGSIGQTGAILAATLNVATTGGAIALTNAGNSFGPATISTSGSDDASLYDSSDLTVASANVGGTLTLSSGGAIGQTGAIHAAALNAATTAGAIMLTNSGNNFGTVTLSTSGTDDASVFDATNLVVASANIGGDLTLSVDGSLGQTGAIHAASLNATTTGGAINLTNAGNSFAIATLATAGTDNASLYDAVDLTIAGATVGGTLTLSGGGAIGQSGAIHAASLIAGTTHGAITLTNAGNTVATATLSTSGADDASFTDASNLIIASANVGGTLTLSGGGSIGQTGAIHAAGLNVGTTGGDITLSNAGNNFATAAVSTAGTDDATLYDASALTISSANVGGTFDLSGAGAIDQTGAIHAAVLNVSTTGGDITLTDSANSFATASVSTTGANNASLYDSADLTVSSANVGGTLTLSGGGTIGQTGAIQAAILNVSALGSITLANTSNSFAMASVSTDEDATLYDASALVVTSADVSGTLTLTSEGPLSQSGAIHAHALIATTTNGAIDLTNSGNTFDIANVTTSGTDNASLHDATALSLSGANVGGTLTLTADGPISQSGAIHAQALNASTTDGSITLTDNGNNFAVASLATQGDDDASLYDAAALTIASANVGGTLTLSGGAAIGQSGAIHADALNVSTTVGAIALSNTGNSFQTATLETADGYDAALYDASNLVIASATVGGDLTLSGGGSIGQTGAIDAHSLNVTTTGGDIALTNAGNAFDTLNATTAGTHDASFHDASDLTISGASVGGLLTVTGGGTIGQSGAIHADALNVSTTAGGITLNDDGNVFNTLTTSTGGSDDASFHDSVALAIAGADVGGILTVTSDGDISQTGAIHADALVASTTNSDIDLTDAGNAFADATLSATGDASLHDASALNIAGATAGGTLTLSGDAGITQTGAIHADTLNVSTTAGDIVLTNTGNAFNAASVATSGSDDASLYDTASLTIASANVGGALALTSEGAIGQTGAIHAASLNATATGGDIALSNTGNAFATAALSTSGSDDATLYDASALTIASANVGGTLTLSGGSSIGQSGAIHAAALNVGTTHGAIALTNAGNSFATATVSTAGSDDASLTDASALTVASANVGGTLTLSSGSAIGQTGAIHAHALDVSTTSGAITLTDSGNNFANATLSTGGSDNASLYDGADLTVAGATVGGTLNLSGGGAIGQSGAIHAAALNVTTTHGAINLANSGNSFAVATLATAGTDDATLYDAAALTISSANIGGDLSLSGGSSIGQSGAIHAKSLTVSSTGGAIVLADAGNTFDTLAVTTSGTNGATFADAANLTVASANVGGTLKVTANAIGQSGAIHAGALNATATSGAIDLTNSGNSFANAALTTSGNNNASLYDASALVIDDADVGGTLTVSAGGAISQIDAIHANALNVTTTSGQISLTSANNAFNSANLSTPGSAWLYDGSSLTLTGANVGGSLTVLSRHDLTFVSSVQAKTGLLAVAGWDGTTVDPAALVAGTAYANNGGSIVVGGANAQGDVAVGSQGGTTTLAANNVTLSATNGYAQLGYHGAGTSAISVYAKGDLTLSGGAQAGRFAQIGNGGYQVSGNETGDIYISATGNLALNAGSGQAAYAQIGHGGAQSNSSSHGYSDTGHVTIGAKTVTVAAGSGTGSYAQIGHGGYLSGQSLLGGTATLGGDITVTTVSGIALTGNGTAAYAQIGHGGDLVNNNAANGTSGTISGDITASVSTKPSDPSVDPVTAIAGSGDESYAQIGNGGSGENSPASGGTVSFTVSGNLFVDDIRLRGSNTGARGYAQIGNGDAGKNGTGDISGDITIGNGFHVDAAGGSAEDTAAIIGNDTGFGTVTGLVTYLSNPNPPPPPPPPPPTVGSSGGAIAVVIQKPTENIGNIVVVTVPVTNVPDINLTDTGGSNHGPGPLEQLVDSNSDGKSSEGEQASDSASESLGKSLDAGRKSASREIMPGLTRNMTRHPHAVPPADVDYSSWGNEAFWVW